MTYRVTLRLAEGFENRKSNKKAGGNISCRPLDFFQSLKRAFIIVFT